MSTHKSLTSKPDIDTNVDEFFDYLAQSIIPYLFHHEINLDETKLNN